MSLSFCLQEANGQYFTAYLQLVEKYSEANVELVTFVSIKIQTAAKANRYFFIHMRSFCEDTVFLIVSNITSLRCHEMFQATEKPEGMQFSYLQEC